MNNLLKINKYTLGVGDRFAHQAAAQLQACILAGQYGVEISPTWNKSNREHTIIGSEPASVRAAADAAVKAAGWRSRRRRRGRSPARGMCGLIQSGAAPLSR